MKPQAAKKSHRARYELFLACLQEARYAADLSQVEMARRLGQTQTFISKCERGERRLDVIDLLDFMEALGHDPNTFLIHLRSKIKKSGT